MANSYYISRKAKLLKDFDKTVDCVKEIFTSRYGEQFANTILKESREEFETLIPQLPYVRGFMPALRFFVVVSAWELALYKAMKEHGKSPAETWQLCHEALKFRLQKVPKFVRRVLWFYLFSDFVMKRARKIAEKTQKSPFGRWKFRFVEGDGKNFDWGVDYTGCTIYEFMKDQGAEEFAPYVCMSDIALSDVLGWGLIRTQTLADGSDRCDFRFRKGAKTQVSSPISQVQKTIEKIEKNESTEE